MSVKVPDPDPKHYTRYLVRFYMFIFNLKEEDILLKRLAEATNYREWDAIAKEMGTGRPAISCFTRYLDLITVYK